MTTRPGATDGTSNLMADGQALELNTEMVNSLLAQGAVRTRAMEDAFRTVPRHLFLPRVPLHEVYGGGAIVTHLGPDGTAISSSSDPAIMAHMLEQLDLRAGHRVLEIGTGTGYNAALIARMVGADGAVATVDLDASITDLARTAVRRAGIENVSVLAGDGWTGATRHAPFDRIIVTVGVSDLSPAWLDQLTPTGVLVAPLWLRAGLQVSVGFRRGGGPLRSTSVTPCGFMRLRGPSAGPERYVQIGDWTVGVEDAGGQSPLLLEELLQQQPHTRPIADLDRNWFVPIALGNPGAVALTTSRDGQAISWAGLLETSAATLAVVESKGWPLSGSPICVHAFGGAAAGERLLDLIERTRPVALEQLAVEAWRSTSLAGSGEAMAVLERKEFTFVVRAPS